MSIDTCIDNVGEYYSAHYLDSTLAKDTKPTLDAWRQRGSDAPPKRLAGLGERYFRAKEQALKGEENGDRGADLVSWHHQLLAALGYTDLSPLEHAVEGETLAVPLLAFYSRMGKPWLAIAETRFISHSSDEDADLDPLDERPSGEPELLYPETWEKALLHLFTEEEPPRWAMLLSGSTVSLFDRHTFAQGRYLRFDLDDAFARKETKTFEALSIFLSKETLCPDADGGDVLHDKLEEQSHKFAYGVSEALQGAVRDAIERIANEWVALRRKKKLSYKLRTEAEMRDGSPPEITAEDLRHEALVYVYRLLFCFYAEARGGELGILPIGDPAYRTGYSLEALRELELVPLSQEAAEGTYFHEHLQRLFALIHTGFHPDGDRSEQQRIFNTDTTKAFQIMPLTATLFNPTATPLLSKVALRNGCLQAVIRGLSLVKDQKTRSRGRVNYAELGINQLGAVYEGLLSYKGMFAEAELIRVKAKGADVNDSKTQSWFVPKARLTDFHEDEVERLESGQLRLYPEGTFILHLNGIDRQRSASYYTPEVLTRCLVEEALRELLKDYKPEDADKILELKICEPAMGSGAFLNEAAAQLAERYLELKKRQTGLTLDPARYADEHRRVRHYIAVNNIYGVDLNATAVELGALSLWLGSMHRLLIEDPEEKGNDRYQPGATPWFGLRLRAGNSLIGARRAVWTKEQIRQGAFCGKSAVPPRQLKPGEKRAKDEIYHFLIFDEDMISSSREPFLRKHWKAECEAANDWRKAHVTKKYDPSELADLLKVSELIDHHFERYETERDEALRRTACTATVWPTPSDSKEALKPGPALEEQERIKAELESTSGSFQRLRLLMDAWCCLWFWSVIPGPDGRTVELPTRRAWIAACELILSNERPGEERIGFMTLALGFEMKALIAAAQGNVPDVDAISHVLPWVREAREIAGRSVFFHWELSFPEVLVSGRGFDLILGNPPWIKTSFDELSVVSEIDPQVGIEGGKKGAVNKAKERLLSDDDNRQFFASKLEGAVGEARYLGSLYYAELAGGQTNLYKNFIVSSWRLLGEAGIGGLVHPTGVFDETKAVYLRQLYYSRLKLHAQFHNERALFAENHHEMVFSLNVFRGESGAADFLMVANLFHPSTLEQCRTKSAPGVSVPAIRDGNRNWELRGHPSRLVRITESDLKILAKLSGVEEDEALAPPLPQLHSAEIKAVVEKIAAQPSIENSGIVCTVQRYYDESGAVSAGEITRQDNPSYQPATPDDVILTGPLFHVANPFYQTAKTACTTNLAFDRLDLTELPEDFLPRTVYRPGDLNGDRKGFEAVKRAVGVNTVLKRSIVDDYRFAFRRMVALSGERSLIGALAPPGTTAIHAVMLAASSRQRDLLSISCVACSLVGDFLIKVRGRADVYERDLFSLPVLQDPFITPAIRRILRLHCLTEAYSKLWIESFERDPSDKFTSADAHVQENACELRWSDLRGNEWKPQCGLRTDLSRRQALLEIDVLVALNVGITLPELRAIYAVQFPVFRSYEATDEYDSRGMRLPSTDRKSPGAKELREARRGHDGRSSITVSWPVDDGRRMVTKTFHPPFTKVDREADYERAYNVFKERLGL